MTTIIKNTILNIISYYTKNKRFDENQWNTLKNLLKT